MMQVKDVDFFAKIIPHNAKEHHFDMTSAVIVSLKSHQLIPKTWKMLQLAVFAGLLAVAAAGVVTPVPLCGGAGQALQLRVTDCDGAPPCYLVPGRTYTVEGDFIASADSLGLSFNLTMIFGDLEYHALDQEIPGSAVEAGKSYTIAYPLTPEVGSGGIEAVFKIEIYDTVSGRVEVCFQAPAVIQDGKLVLRKKL